MLGITHGRITGARGFTLIEMSIVLVIIGLIIGGILKGQEIIESSRQKNVISQIDAIKSAVNTFADKYNALPGDYNRAVETIATSMTNGDRNGVVGTNYASSTAMNAASTGVQAENSEFWDHLAGAGLLAGTTINGGVTAFGDTAQLPATAIPGSGMTVVYGVHNVNTTNAKQSHWLRVHKDPDGVMTAGTATIGAFSGKRLFEIDLKTDDGNGSQGVTRVMAADAACSNATGTYVATSNDQNCAGYFELLQ